MNDMPPPSPVPPVSKDPTAALLDAVAQFVALDLPGRALLNVRIQLDDGSRIKLKRGHSAGPWTLTIDVPLRPAK
jgi:hypothetical protein